MNKTCKACGLTKPTDQFHKDKQKPDGLCPYCKPCMCAKQKEYTSHPPRTDAPDGLKWCGRCKQNKPPEEFHRSTRTYDGWDKRCKQCSYEDHKAWIEKNPSKAAALQKKWRDTNPRRSKDHKLKSNYGIPIGSYEKMFSAQGGKCAICGTDKSGGKGDFHVDHCHDSGNVRALLCHHCNLGIGNFHHDKNKLLLAINYLDRHQPKVLV